ncbi:uncharacterized protein LOC133868055 [Alnus glutinosa]|uniref:uncharacterized protein LOC133868055 n=1 Tax=Alnus glutinosa TaxID=3517 RepID=UPI002D7A0DA1|nr:uncharacterized protein LOC133868055 [Alnus glutinosa]
MENNLVKVSIHVESSNSTNLIFSLSLSLQLRSFSLDLIRATRFLSSSFYKIWESMGRGVSIGGGQSSLGYLFGSGEAPKPATTNAETAPNEVQAVNNAPASKPATASH